MNAGATIGDAGTSEHKLTQVCWTQFSWNKGEISVLFSASLKEPHQTTPHAPMCCSSIYWLTKRAKLIILNCRAPANEILVAYRIQSDPRCNTQILFLSLGNIANEEGKQLKCPI